MSKVQHNKIVLQLEMLNLNFNHQYEKWNELMKYDKLKSKLIPGSLSTQG